MKILIYRYSSICEPDVISAFRLFDLEVIEERHNLEDDNLSNRIKNLSKAIDYNKPLFVFSINFFPFIADVCNIYQIPYVCWTVDSPVLELFSTSVKHNTNCIFLFDYSQYLYFSKFNPNNIFYLPLASATDRFEAVLKEHPNIKDRRRFSADISFVGSLYSEKNNMKNIEDKLTEYVKGYIDGVVASSLNVYGVNFIENCVNEDVIKYFKNASVCFYDNDNLVANADSYIVANDYIGIQVTEKERISTLNMLAKYYNVDLFTMSDTAPLKNVHIHEGVNSLSEMPHVFKNSKINLNMTSKSIQTGIPLRVFDIMGCGGFVMTNYQAELSNYFEIGVELEAYSSLDELVDKCNYYLKHDEARGKIALNGYEKVRTKHTYADRISIMVAEVLKVLERF